MMGRYQHRGFLPEDYDSRNVPEKPARVVRCSKCGGPVELRCVHCHAKGSLAAGNKVSLNRDTKGGV